MQDHSSKELSAVPKAFSTHRHWPSHVLLVVKNLLANAGDVRDRGSISGSGGNGYPLQYSCLENPKDTGDLKATVHRVAQSWT